jgi:hypothetical protein
MNRIGPAAVVLQEARLPPATGVGETPNGGGLERRSESPDPDNDRRRTWR